MPRQVLALFTHGMGGMFDPALTRNGVADNAANDRRELLAERLVAAAKAELQRVGAFSPTAQPYASPMSASRASRRTDGFAPG